MTQPLKQDERVLDYIYGELDEGERSAFEAQLAEDAALRDEVESLQGVSKAFRGLPKLTQSADSVQAMTALLMEQAAQVHGRPETAAKLEAARVVDEGAKVIPLRGRTLRRIFTSPASGIFAAAAAALFWVVLKSQGPSPVPLPNSPQKLEPVAAMAPPPPAGAPVAVSPDEKARAADELAPNAPNVPLREAFSEALKKAAPPAVNLPPATEPTTLAMATAKGAGPKKMAYGKAKADLDSLLDVQEGKAAEKKPLVVAMAPTDKKTRGVDDYESRRFAQPPPPMKAEEPPAEAPAAKPTVRQQMAQAGDRRKDRIVEELANQELGSLPGRGAPAASAPPAAAPPPPASPAEPEGRYAQAPRQPAPNADEAPAAGAAPSTADSQQYAQNSAPSGAQNYVQNLEKNSTGRRVSNMNDGDSGGSAMLQTVQDQLRQGRCSEANATLTRVEQSFPATAGLAEARAQWQRSCQLVPQNQAPTPAMQMPQAAPAPTKPAPRMELEQVYSPSSRSSMPMNKAPIYRAKKAAPPPTQQQKVRGPDKAAADAY